MSKVTMPKPVASTVAGTRTMQDRDGASFCLTTIIHSPAFMPYPGTKLITTTQAEAYTAAKVREALEKAESIVRSNADACFSFVVKAMLHSNADAIRTLISKEQE